MKIGLGYDIHLLVPPSSPTTLTSPSGFWLGGVFIEASFCVKAVSDGDVLLHALVDAMLGALALGNIGERYPETNQINNNRKSTEFVSEVLSELSQKSYKVTQVDSVIYLETPKLSPYLINIRQSLSSMLCLPMDCISVKPKTKEGLENSSQKQSIAAHVIIILQSS